MKKYLKYIIIFFCILTFKFIIFPITADDIWCYGFSHNIYMGLLPYKDFNMIITPLFPFIFSLPFHIFGSNILVFFISTSLVFTLLSSFLFKLVGDKGWLILAVFWLPVECFSPQYNVLLLFLTIILIWLELNNKSDYLIGLVIALAILTKQSVGILFLLPSFLYLKEPKKILKRLEIIISIMLIFVLYLIFTKSFYQFVDLCFLGLFDFAQKNGFIAIVPFIIFICIVISTLLLIKKNPKNIFNYYALCFYTIDYPLFDYSHTSWLLMIFMLVLFLQINDFKINCKIIFAFTYIVFTVFLLKNDFFSCHYYKNINHFEYSPINDTIMEYIKQTNKMIKKYSDYDFMFLDGNGYYFKIINDIPITNLDLINNGNNGYNGSYKLIKKIKKNNKMIFFVGKKKINKNSQEDKKVINYVVNNGKIIDSNKYYYIYTLK